MNDLTVTDTDRLHAIIDRVARVASRAFEDAPHSESLAPVLDRLARRAERTVRLVSYEYLNDLERY